MNKQNRWSVAGKELIRGNFGNAFKSLLPQSDVQVDLDPATYRGNTWWFFGNDGIEYPFNYDNRNSSLKAYQQCPPVAAIINRKAQAYINGKTWVMNTRGKEATSVAADKLRKLMMTPNPLQSGRQFEAQTYIYQQIFGFAIWMPIIPTGYKKYGPIEATSLWNIPPFMVDIEESDTIYYSNGAKLIKKITLNYRNQKVEIDPASVFIIKDFTPSFSSLVIPESRICALKMPINNIIGAYESENVIINRRGPDFMISSDSRDGIGMAPMSTKDRDEVEKEFRSYGLRKGQRRAIITSAAVKWQSLSFPVKDLMLHESVKENTKAVCDGYNYPPHLLGLIDPTFNNQNAAEKGLYNNAIIPESISITEQLNQVFRTSEYNIRIEKDYSHIPVLQEDKRAENMARKTLGEALINEYKNNLITRNRVLELLGEDTIGPSGDVYYRDEVGNTPPLTVNENGLLTTTTSNGQG